MTPTRSLILHPHEIRAALRGELRLVVRPVKPQPEYQDDTGRWSFCVSSTERKDEGKFSYRVIDPAGHSYTERGRERVVLSLRDPFGVPGTRLVCRERWAWSGDIEIPEDQRVRMGDVWYYVDPERENPAIRWRSPATMPAWASRITLEVVSVGVGRVGGLTEDDALSSGFDQHPKGIIIPYSNPPQHQDIPAMEWLKYAWNARYATKGLGWDKSPWAWKVAVKGGRSENA